MELHCDFNPSGKYDAPNATVPATLDLQNLPVDQWVQLHGSVTAPPDADNMLFAIHCIAEAGHGGVLFLDDVKIEPVPSR